MTTQLPSNPNLSQLKNRAKTILKAHKAGDASGCSKLKNLPKLQNASDEEILKTEVSLADVQHALANEYGFKNWRELKKEVLGRTDNLKFLHIHNGDVNAQAISDSSIPGDNLAWREIYIEGPVPGNVSEDELCRIRAQYFTETGVTKSVDGALQGIKDRYKTVEEAGKYEEVILWFDACMFDQTMMLYVIDLCAKQSWPDTKLSLICVDQAIGDSEPTELLDNRHAVSANEIALARNGWAAFTSDNPADIETLLQGDCSALPYLKDALLRHLQQFPSVGNGLSRLENEILECVSSGADKLGDLFSAVSDKEERPFLGDTSLWQYIEELAECDVPLLKIEGPGRLSDHIKPDSEQDDAPSLKDIRRWTVSISDAGRDVLRARRDHIKLNGVDRWLGGVHLQGIVAQWRWDDKERQLIEDYTSLHMASLSGNTDAVKKLLHENVNVRAEDDDGYIALHHAAAFCDGQTVRSLVDAGSDPNSASSDGQTPLHAAAWYGNDEAIEELISAGADVNARYNTNGQSVLFNAATFGKKRAVELLLNAGADMSITTNDGATPLHAAVRRWPQPGDADVSVRSMTRALHESGYDSSDETANEVVDLLLGHGADVNAQDNAGKTPLQFAQSSGRKETVEFLVSKGAKEDSGIIAAAGSLPEMRYVNFLLRRMSREAPTSVALQADEPLPVVVDLETGKPVETDFGHVLHRIQAMSPKGDDIDLLLEGKRYVVKLDLKREPHPKCMIHLEQRTSDQVTELRPYVQEDIPDMLVIAEKLSPTWIHGSRLKDMPVDLRCQHGFVAIEGEDIVGFISFTSKDAVPYIQSLNVDPALRRKGIGRRLIGTAEDEAREAGAEILRVVAMGWTRPFNRPHAETLKFYKALGFVVVEKHPMIEEDNGNRWRLYTLEKKLR